MLLPASQNFTKLLPSSILLFSYGISFYFLAVVTQKLPLSVVYATWSGMGVFTVAMFIVPIERVQALADISNLFYISGAGIVGTYMGTSAYMAKNGVK